MARSALMAASLVLAGFAGGAAAQDQSYFWFSVQGGFAIGNALPGAFSDGEIVAVLNAVCPGGPVTGYTSGPDGQGYNAFSASCPGGYSVVSGYHSVDRLSNGALRLNPAR